jgi:exopolysaccharide biosynthesis polyprenyl glycosylphosphotransferase
MVWRGSLFKRFSVNYAVFSISVDTGCTTLALLMAAAVRPDLPPVPFLVPVPEIELPLYLYVIAPFLWVSIFLLASVYDPKRIYKAVDELQSVSLASGFAALAFAGLLYLVDREVSRWLFVLFLLLNVGLLLGWRILARALLLVIKLPPAPRNVLIVGAGGVGRQVAKMIQEYRWTGLQLVGYLDDDFRKHNNGLPVVGTLKQVRQVVAQRQIDDVVIALPRPAYDQVNRMVVELHDLPVQVRVVPDYFSLALHRATIEDFGGLPLINLRDPALNDVQRLIKRSFDLIVGGFLTILALPLMGMVALLIRLDTPGEVLFRQKRVGENGQLFTMYKFRSMIINAQNLQDQVSEWNEKGELFYKRPDDPRITRMGRLIRRTSLDELPQLFNVLKGDMSLVGPRPELPWLADQYKPWQRKRFAVPQGITGWWQVNGRADKPLHLHSEDDLYYVQNYSLWMDIYILVKTVWVVLRGKGAY